MWLTLAKMTKVSKPQLAYLQKEPGDTNYPACLQGLLC